MSVAKKIVDRKILRELVPLNTLSRARFEEISRKIIIEEVRAGSHLFRINDRDNQTVYLLGGEIDLLDGKHKPSITIKADSDKSRYPLADAQPRVMSARAVKKCVVARIDSGLLDAFLSWDQSNTAEAVSIGADENADWMTRMLQSQAFENIPPAKIQRLLLKMESVHFKAGATVIRQGETGDYFYTIKSGRCAVTRRDTSQAEDSLLAELSDGDCFGEESLVLDVERNATVSMLTDGVLMRLAKQDFVELLQNPLVRNVNYEKAAAMVDEGAVWVDVRTADEYDSCALEDSVNIPLFSVRGEMPDLVFNVVYVICCDTGQRSASAAFILRHKGFDVYVLQGGLQAVPGDVFSHAPDSSATAPEVAARIPGFEQQVVTQQDQKQRLESDLASAYEQQVLLQGQMDELKQLAQTAAELQEQKQQLESDLASAHELQVSLEHQMGELKSLYEQDKQQLEMGADALERSATALQGDVGRLEVRTSEQAEKIDRLLADKQAVTEALDRQTQEWEEERALLRSGNEETQQQLAELEKQLEQAREKDAGDKSRLLEDLEAVRKERDSFQQELDAVMDAAAGQQQKIEGLKAQVASVAGSADEQVQSLEILLEAGRLQLEELQQQAADRLAQQHAMQDELAGMKQAESRLEQEAVALQQQKEELQQALEQESARQQEHEQRLAQAHDDLARKHEIEQELQGRLDQLNRELEQTTAELQEQKQQLEADLSGATERQALLEGQLDELRQQHEQDRQQLAMDADERLQVLEVQLEAGRLQLEELQQQAADRLAQQNNLQEELAAMKQAESRLEQEAVALQQQKEELQQALEQESARQQEHEQRLAQAHDDLARKHEIEQELQGRLDQLNRELEQTTAELQEQKQQLEADLSGATERQALLEGQLDELKQQHEQERRQLESDADEYERSVTALQSEAGQLEVRIREQAEKIDHLLTDKQVVAEALDRQMQEWDRERALFRSGSDETQQQLAELREQLEQACERGAGEKAGLQAELDALTSKTNRKIKDREAQCVELRQGQSRLLEDLEAVRKERDSFQQELGAAMDTAAGQQQKIEALKTQVASVAGSADEQVQSLEIQLEAGRIQLENLERQAADRLAQQDAMQEEMAGMNATESRLVQEAMVLQQEKEALQQALQQRDAQETARQLEQEQLLAQANVDLTGKNEIERELQGQVDRLRKKLEQTTSELQDVREVAQTDIDSIREELHKERSARSAERAEMAARQRELKEQLMSVATEHEENLTNHSGAIEQAQITAREEEQARVQQMREIQLEAEDHLERLQSELSQAHEEIAALVEREKTRRHAEHDLSEDRKEQSEPTLNQLRTQTEQLVQERDAALREQHAMREKMNSLRAEVEVVRGLMGGGQGQVEDPLKLRHELDEARKNVEIAVRLRAAADATCASLKEERDALQKQVGNTLNLGKPLNIPLLDQNPKQADRPVFPAKPAKKQAVTPAAGKQSGKPSGAVAGRWGRLARMTGLGVIVFAGILYALKTYIDLPVEVVTPGQDVGEVVTHTSSASDEESDSGPVAGSQVRVSGQETVPVVESAQPVMHEPQAQAAQTIEPSKPATEAATRPQRLAAAGSFQERLQGGGVAPLMVKLPAADFMMGSPGNSLNGDEGPQHEVSLSRFAISKYEVTFADYDRFARATRARLPHDEAWGRGNRPVINVSWKDAQAYVKWLSAQTGHTYRLPTEAQWEFAARAGATTPFPWEFGTEAVSANCFDCGSEWDKSRTAPVGSFPGNYFGLHDMGGNAREWTEDCYRTGYEGAPGDGSALMIFGCTQRAVRGGGYTSPRNSLRSAHRGQYDQDTRLDNLGFRIVRNY